MEAQHCRSPCPALQGGAVPWRREFPGRRIGGARGTLCTAPGCVDLPVRCAPWGSSGDFAQHLLANSHWPRIWPRMRLAGLATGAAAGRCSRGRLSSISMHPKAPAPGGRAACGSLRFKIKTVSRLPMAKKSWKLGPQQPRNLKAPRGMVPYPEVSQCLSQAGDFSEPAAQGEPG